MKYTVFFKWRDFFDDEHFETKEFKSYYKAYNFMQKLKRETRSLVRKYGRSGVYNPYYDISILEEEN